MTGFLERRLLRTKDLPDLGRLELWSWQSKRRLWGLLQPRETFLRWEGVTGRVPFHLDVDHGVDADAQLAFLDAQVRAVIASLGDREPALRREVARREIGLARDWSDNQDLSEEAFAESLRGGAFVVYADAKGALIDLCYSDTGSIFADHSLTVSLDQSGHIVSIGLEG